MHTSFASMVGLLGFGEYPEESRFADMYYIEMGTAPQSFAGTTSTINATETTEKWIDNNLYYIDDNNPKIKYVKKGDNYYLIEPIRWIIIADENYSSDNGVYGVDYFSNTTLTDLDKTALNENRSRQIVVMSERLITNFSFTNYFGDYSSQMTNLRNKIFTTKEQALLETITLFTYRNSPKTISENFSLLGGKDFAPYDETFHALTYSTSQIVMCASNTAYQENSIINPTTYKDYWTRSYLYESSGCQYYYYSISSNGNLTYQMSSGGNTASRGIRPVFVISL